MVVRKLSPSRLKKLIAFSLNSHMGVVPSSRLVQSLVIEPFSVVSPFSEIPGKALPSHFCARLFSSISVNNPVFTKFPILRDGNYDETAEKSFPVCPGCGIQMQDLEPKQPGYFIPPSPKGPNYKKFKKMTPITDESEVSDLLKSGLANEIIDAGTSKNLEIEDKALDEMTQRVQDSESTDEKLATPIVCARCHSLRYYQKVKYPGVENLLPDFDFDHTVGRRLMSIDGARTVILLLADAADFDGSFPRKVATSVFKTIHDHSRSWKEGKPGNIPRVLLVLTKIDLLPTSISPTRLNQWVRIRAREAGAGKLTGVHMVSALKDWGVKTLVDDVIKLSGQRGNVWAVGAQNAGKSTLINAIGKCIGMKTAHLTEASVPGTTLGILRVEGVLPGKAKLFDTPGLLHPHQISTRLTSEEQSLIRIGKELKPRTYRIRAGHSVHIGGLVRMDLEESAVASIYVTVWASPLVPLHMGKTENALTMLDQHFGRQLQPPIGERRVVEMGKWVKKEFHIKGERWDSSSVDIAAAGVGWFGIGLKGECRISVWTYEGVDVIARDSLLPQRSNHFEVSGFTVNEIVSRADRAKSKKQKSLLKSRRGKGNDTVEAIVETDSNPDCSPCPT